MTKTLSFITVFFLWFFGLTSADAIPFESVREAADPIAAAEAELRLRPHAGDEVWRALVRGGAPIIRPDPVRPGFVRATFLYRAATNVEEVRLDSILNAVEVEGRVTDYVRDFTLPLTQVGGSQIWARTLSVPENSEAVYSFLVRTPAGVRRRSDGANPRRLRGGDAESVFFANPGSIHPAIRPVPFSSRLTENAFTIDSVALERPVFMAVYTHPEAQPRSPVLVIYDSFLWGVRAPAVEIVQNLVARGAIEPVNVVLIDQLDTAGADNQYRDQLGFLEDELPTALAERGILGQRIIAGASRRGLVAVMAGLDQPEAVEAVISLSGSFYWSPDGEAPEWLARNVAEAREDRPRFILAAGQLEYVETSTNQGHVMLEANRNMARALAARDHEVDLIIYQGGHDVAGWRSALARALELLFSED